MKEILLIWFAMLLVCGCSYLQYYTLQDLSYKTYVSVNETCKLNNSKAIDQGIFTHLCSNSITKKIYGVLEKD